MDPNPNTDTNPNLDSNPNPTPILTVQTPTVQISSGYPSFHRRPV